MIQYGHGRADQKYSRRQPGRDESPESRHDQLLESFQVGADFFLQFCLPREQRLCVRRQIRLRPGALRREQTPEFAAGENFAGGFFQRLQRGNVFCRGGAEVLQRGGGGGQRFIASAFGFQGAGLDFVFGPSVLLGDVVQDTSEDGGVSLMQAGFEPLVTVLLPPFSFLERAGFIRGALGQSGGALHGGVLGPFGGGGRLRAKFTDQLFFARRKVLDDTFERLQERNDLADCRMPVRHVFGSS